MTQSTSQYFVNQTLEVTVESLSSQGMGVARHQGLVIFVVGGVPGDYLKIQITKLKKRMADASIQQVMKASDWRQRPECPSFGVCGGCSWQHIKYEYQLTAKQEILHQQLLRIGKIQAPIQPIVPSPRPFYYRNRIQLQHGQFGVGYFKRQGHEIIPITNCAIARPELNEVIKEIPPLLGDSAPQRVEIFISIMDHKAHWHTLHQGRSIEGFSQVNEDQNRNLISQIASWLQPENAKNPLARVVDLYGGAGNFTLRLARQFTQTHFAVVETSPTSIKLGRSLAEEMGLNNISFFEEPVEDYLHREQGPSKLNKLVIVDPPRAGLSLAARKALLAYAPSSLIYVSCHPGTLARDLQFLLGENRNYQIKSIQPFDMFPQTPHLEIAAYLSTT